MGFLRTALPTILMSLFIMSCSVISQQVKKESISHINFRILLYETDKYIGNTVILGGYILETRNLADKSILKVLQAPLGFGEEPKSKDYSKGRFIISQKGFLDPEIYSKDRKITVAGTIIGVVIEKVDNFQQRYLKIESRELYLWPKDPYYYPPPYYDPWYYPYPYYWPWYSRYPYYW